MVYNYFPLGRDNNDCEPHSVRSNSWTFCKIKISWKFVASFNIRFKIKTDIFSIFTISVNFWNHRNLSVCFDFYPFFNVRLKNWLIRFYFLVTDFWLNLEEEFVKGSVVIVSKNIWKWGELLSKVWNR